MTSKSTPPSHSSSSDKMPKTDKKQQLASALRANLQRRKAAPRPAAGDTSSED